MAQYHAKNAMAIARRKSDYYFKNKEESHEREKSQSCFSLFFKIVPFASAQNTTKQTPKLKYILLALQRTMSSIDLSPQTGSIDKYKRSYKHQKLTLFSII